MSMFEDTIAAIATANAMGAVSVIRVSGDEAISIVSKIMHKDLSEKEGYTITYGYIYEEDVQVDEVLACVFKAPKSFTGEDIVEINFFCVCRFAKRLFSRVIRRPLSVRPLFAPVWCGTVAALAPLAFHGSVCCANGHNGPGRVGRRYDEPNVYERVCTLCGSLHQSHHHCCRRCHVVILLTCQIAKPPRQLVGKR